MKNQGVFIVQHGHEQLGPPHDAADAPAFQHFRLSPEQDLRRDQARLDDALAAGLGIQAPGDGLIYFVILF